MDKTSVFQLIFSSMFLLVLSPCALCEPAVVCEKIRKPKAVILLYADDLGYGDLGCYGAKAIPTPNVDKLAAQGLLFTDAYSTSATCTPSRYALMTGQYPWRQRGTGVLPGDASMIVPPADKHATLASVMKAAGYKTAAIGKWHLGLGRGKIDWNEPQTHGLNKVGFDESFIIAATADRVPCVYLRNGSVENLDPKDPIKVSYKKNFEGQATGKNNPDLLRYTPSHGHAQTIVNGISRIGYMKGGRSALWKDQDMADTITQEAIKFMEKNKETPFFLYFATNDIHVPRDPHQRFLGKSQCGIRGDVTVQFDDCVGRIMDTVKRLGLEKDTLVIMSSDNGPVVDDGYNDGAKEKLGNHRPNGPLSGGKYSLLEGGTRVPFVVSWPGVVPHGKTNKLMCQIDIAPTLAAIVGTSLKEDDFPDGEALPAGLMTIDGAGRDHLILSNGGTATTYRQGHYKYFPPHSFQRTTLNGNEEAHRTVGKEGALYDLSADIAEENNLVDKNFALAEEMRKQWELIKAKPTRPL